jgi:hypothetical protein
MSGDRRQVISDWRTQIALGLYPDLEAIHKFGTNDAVGTSEETIWNMGGEYTWLTTGTEMEIVCTDDVNGQGQTIEIYGLDENWLEKTERYDLTGQTPVPIGQWTVILRAFQVSASPDPVGDVYIATTAATYVGGVPQELNLTQAKIDFTDAAQITEQAFVIVPAGNVGVLWDFEAQMKQATGTARTADCLIEVAQLARGATSDNPSWAPRKLADAVQVGTVSPVAKEDLTFPLVFPELTRIEARAVATAASSVRMDFTVTFVPIE